jgi:hypothetical protein
MQTIEVVSYCSISSVDCALPELELFCDLLLLLHNVCLLLTLKQIDNAIEFCLSNFVERREYSILEKREFMIILE